MSDTFDEQDEQIAQLVAEGYLDFEMDGDETYLRPTDKMQTELPELYEMFQQAALKEINDAMENMMEAGLIELAGVDEHGEITYKLTDLGNEFYKSQAQE